jgi:hypothetical protein
MKTILIALSLSFVSISAVADIFVGAGFGSGKSTVFVGNTYDIVAVRAGIEADDSNVMKYTDVDLHAYGVPVGTPYVDTKNPRAYVDVLLPFQVSNRVSVYIGGGLKKTVYTDDVDNVMDVLGKSTGGRAMFGIGANFSHRVTGYAENLYQSGESKHGSFMAGLAYLF